MLRQARKMGTCLEARGLARESWGSANELKTKQQQQSVPILAQAFGPEGWSHIVVKESECEDMGACCCRRCGRQADCTDQSAGGHSSP